MPLRLVLVHGVATTGSIWAATVRSLQERLPDADVLVVDRPCTGELADEVAALDEVVRGGVVVGQSGGATLALALAATGRTRAAVAHEPAVGSLLPGLLAPVRTALESGGVSAFGKALYGKGWEPALAADLDLATVTREVEMFAGFEPTPPTEPQSVLVTTGEHSMPVRHAAAAALVERFGVRAELLPGCGHFASAENPDGFADLVARHLRTRIRA